jgi:hypothetical protein
MATNMKAFAHKAIYKTLAKPLFFSAQLRSISDTLRIWAFARRCGFEECQSRLAHKPWRINLAHKPVVRYAFSAYPMGKHNSSLTRVRPFFGALLARDPSGRSWLRELLKSSPNRAAFADDLSVDPGPLIRADLDPEKKLYPAPEFLRWLILNADKLTWPENGTRQFGKETQARRKQLFDGSGEVARAALRELEREGASKSERKWWAFEGCTFVDCYLETERLKLYVEGKRTEMLSAATDWYPTRNQLLRNLESARADAKGKPFAVLLIVETPQPELTSKQVENGLPHLSPVDRAALTQHYLGTVTWREACEATGVEYASLPNLVESPP